MLNFCCQQFSTPLPTSTILFIGAPNWGSCKITMNNVAFIFWHYRRSGFGAQNSANFSKTAIQKMWSKNVAKNKSQINLLPFQQLLFPGESFEFPKFLPNLFSFFWWTCSTFEWRKCLNIMSQFPGWIKKDFRRGPLIQKLKCFERWSRTRWPTLGPTWLIANT